MNPLYEIFIDGACRGNPGPASVGVVIYQKETKVKTLAKAIGQATNNFAEYTALIYALQEAHALKASHIRIHTDSELLYNQIKGDYKIKEPKLKSLFEQVQDLAKKFKSIEFKKIPREENKEADKLASDVLKKEQAKVVAPTFLFK